MSHILRKLNTQNLLVILIFIAIYTMAVRIPADTDTWWHLKSGEYIVETLSIPTTDPFSHTRGGTDWIDHGWLAQIFWYGIFATTSWAGLSLVLALLVTLAFWFVWLQLDEINVFVAAFSMLLGAVVSSVVWVARPQMISFVLTAIVAYLLHRFKRHGESWRLLWLIPIVLLWVNVHGGFAIAFMLMLMYLIGEPVNLFTQHKTDAVLSWRQIGWLGVVFLLCLAVVAVNPYTWQMWLYPFRTVGIDALRDFIQEWRSPDFHLLYVQPFVVMLLLVLLGVARAGRQADWTDLALVALWTGWALFAARNIAIFGLVVTPILARYLNETWVGQWRVWGHENPPFSGPPRRRPNVALNLTLLGVVCLAALVKIIIPLTPQANLATEQQSLPYEAVTFLQEEQPPGPLFNSYNWGGYAIFKLWPTYPVYIDGRTDLYDDAFIRRYLGVVNADEGWQTVLDEDGINLVLIETNSVLAKFLRIEPGWREIHHDDMASVFTRQDTP